MFDEKHRRYRARVEGKDPRIDLLISEKDPVLLDLYTKSYNLYKSAIKKAFVESSLICENDLTKISPIIDVPVPVLEVYKEFFFDIEGLDKLSKFEHIEGVDDDNEKTLKLWALGQGMGFIAWRLGDRVQLSPVDGLVDMFSTCMYKAKESMYSCNTADSSKEALKWTKLSADIARLLKLWTLDNAAARKDLEIAIKEVVPDFMGIDSLI
jgi:hypothetical protein